MLAGNFMTEPKEQTEKEFLRQRNFFEVILERIVSGVCAADREGRIYYVNRGMTAITDIPKEDILATHSLMELFIDRDAVLQSAYDRAKNTLQPIQYIAAPVVLSDTRLRYISGWFIPFITEETLDGMLLTAVDMTEREEAERARQEREEWTKLALKETDEGLWEWRFQEQQLTFHDNWPQRLGYDDMGPGVNVNWWLAHITEESRKRVERQFREHREGRAKYHEFEYEIQTKQGESHWFWVRSKIIERTVDGRPLRIIGTHRDITDRIKLEEAVRKAEKLESLGILAGGIAHDFNNLLTVILGNIDLSLSAHQSGADLFHNLQKATHACDQAKELAQRFLTFSQGGNPKKDITPLAPIILASAEAALSGTNVAARHSLPPDLWTAAIDAAQMRQAIGNIIINAGEATPEGGTVFVKAENIVMSAQNRTSQPFPTAHYIKILIEDKGRGIAAQDLSKIFDPYFTTKKMGAQKGMGLGLTIAYSIIARHDGHITVDSTEGSGTTVTVYLPASSESATGRA